MQLVIENREALNTIIQDIYRNAKYPLNLIAEPVKRMKTKKQLGYIFGGIFQALADYYKDQQGETWTSEDIKTMVYNELNLFEKRQYPNGKEYYNPITISKMTTDQTSMFINAVLDWIDNETDCILHPSLRYCWLLHVTDKQIDEVMSYAAQLRDPAYLNHIRNLTCINCGRYGVEAAHMRINYQAGAGIKPPDWLAIPLCHSCHIERQHTEGKEIKAPYNYDMKVFCKLCYVRWIRKEINS